MAGAYTSIATKTVTGSTDTSIDFTSIPSTYTDLVFKVYLKSSSGGTQGLYVRLNGDSGANYSDTELSATTTTQTSGRDTSQSGFRSIVADNTYWFQGEMEINNYSGATVAKSFWSRGLLKFSFYKNATGLWTGTAAVNQVTFIIPANYFAVGSQITLYGITRA